MLKKTITAPSYGPRRVELSSTELKLWNKLSCSLNIIGDNNYTARKLFDSIVKMYGNNITDPINKHAQELAEQQRFEALVNAFKTIHGFAQCSCDPRQMKGLEDLENYLIKMYRPKVLLKDRVKNILKKANAKYPAPKKRPFVCHETEPLYKGKYIFTSGNPKSKRVFVTKHKGGLSGCDNHATVQAALDFLKMKGIRKPVIQFIR